MTTTTDIKRIVASESAHWYDAKTGEPRYEILGKNGKLRNTTLKDARENGYVPSVTSVLQIIAKPGLDAWKQNNLLLAAATLPRVENMPIETWVDAVLRDSKEQSEKAMELGTNIHAAIEMYLNGETIDEQYVPYIMPVIQEMEKRGWLENRNVEHSFSHHLGFGGKIDYHTDTVLIDFKTTGAKDLTKAMWPEHAWQLAAYSAGVDKKLKCINIYVSTVRIGEFYIHEWSEDEIMDAWQVFYAALDLWKLIKKF